MLMDMISQQVNTASGYNVYDAGPVQRREWMLYKIRPDHYPMCITVSFDVTELDTALVQKAIAILTERHEVLRTTLRVIKGSLKQVVHAPGKIPISFNYYDIKEKKEEEKEPTMAFKTGIARGMPFNFEFGPLFRVLVFELEPALFSVYFIFHHLIFDEHSKEIFKKELGEIYNALAGGVAFPAKEKYPQYRDCTIFENELIDSPKGDEYRKYWENELKAGIPRLQVIDRQKWEDYYSQYLLKVALVKERIYQLPCYDERFLPSVIRRYELEEGGQLKYIYSTEVFDKIAAYRENSQNGLLSLFVASLLLAFHKLSGQANYAFEITGSARSSQRFWHTIGWLTTGAPCFFEIAENFTYDRLLNHIDEQLYLLSKYCILPPETVGYKTDPPTGGHMPVFLTIQYANYNSSEPGRGMLFHHPRGNGTYQDIAFFFTCYKNVISLEIIYNILLFTPNQAELLVDTHLVAMNEILNGINLHQPYQ